MYLVRILCPYLPAKCSWQLVEESGTYIPSESSIKVAKERRERVRKTGAAGEDDFISLTVSRRGDEPQGPHPDSRLVREEDELGEGDDGEFCLFDKSHLSKFS